MSLLCHTYDKNQETHVKETPTLLESNICIVHKVSTQERTVQNNLARYSYSDKQDWRIELSFFPNPETGPDCTASSNSRQFYSISLDMSINERAIEKDET